MKMKQLLISAFAAAVICSSTLGQELKPGDVIWEFETGDWGLASPAIGVDGTVYVGSRDKKVYALAGKTGDKLWEFETGDLVMASPAIGSASQYP